jgi:pyroglutamyl-peptidase
VTILVTGFEPFGGLDYNPSADVATTLGDLPGFVSRILPVSFAAMPPARREAVDAVPDLSLVISCGLASRRRKVCVEVKAVNEKRAAIPDNDGVAADGQPLQLGLPSALRVNAAVADRAYAALRDGGVPVRYSTDAGAYLCNATLFQLLAWDVPAVFIHVPPARLIAPERIALALAGVARGLGDAK